MNQSPKIPLSSAILALALCSAACPVEASEVRVFHNAIIHTVNAGQPQAGAMAFDSTGAILATGESADILASYPEASRRDLDGATVIPGLIDAHGHIHGRALEFTRARLTGSTDKQDIIRRLKAHERNLAPDDWLLGRGWDQNDWPEQVFPTRSDLDEHFPDRPVWLTRIDGHAGWANSAALATVDRDLSGDWQPQGGYIHRDGSGQATGVLIDHAQSLVSDQVPRDSAALVDRALDLALADFSRLGVTGVHDAGVTLERIRHFLEREKQDRLPLRVFVMADGTDAETMEWMCSDHDDMAGAGRVTLRSVKLFSDGALGSRGAALLDEYSDEAGNRGLLFYPDEEIQGQADTAAACGLQVAIHAIGDRGNRQSLDVIESITARFPQNPGRHRVEHVQVLHGDDVPRFARLGVIASYQPTHATSDMYWAERRVGAGRIRHAYAWRSLLESGAKLALGSDFPVEEVNPMLGIYAAVTRMDLAGEPQGGWYPEQRLTRAEALRGFTRDAAFAAFMEDRTGSLEPGKRADFVVLDRDIMTIDAADIPAVKVRETWLDGKLIYTAGKE